MKKPSTIRENYTNIKPDPPGYCICSSSNGNAYSYKGSYKKCQGTCGTRSSDGGCDTWTPGTVPFSINGTNISNC